MKRLLTTLILVLAWVSLGRPDCKPRDYYTRSAKIYIRPSQGKQDLKRAEQLISEALKCYPEDGEVQYTAGWLYSQKKEFGQMMTALNAAVKASAEWKPRVDTLKAVVFQENFDQAYGFLIKGIKATTAKDSVKDLREAIHLYAGCMLIDSTATGPYKNLSVAYNVLGIHDTSTHYDGLAYKIKPDSVRWGYAYAAGLVNLEKYDEAIGVLEKVVQKDTLYWDAWGLLGRLYGAKDSTDKMASVYERLSEHFPDSSEFWGQVALYNLIQGTKATDPKVAIPFLHRSDSLYTLYLRRNPADSNSWYNQGVALNLLKDYTKAVEVLKPAVAKFPGFADAWEALSSAYAHLGKAKDANEAYAQAQKLHGGASKK